MLFYTKWSGKASLSRDLKENREPSRYLWEGHSRQRGSHKCNGPEVERLQDSEEAHAAGVQWVRRRWTEVGRGQVYPKCDGRATRVS